MIFTPRLDYTGTDTLDYYTTANPFYYAYDYDYDPPQYLWMPNCTAYAYGRWQELDQNHNLTPYLWPRGNGEDWWDEAPGLGLQRGQTPSIGAAMCWSYTDGSVGGHVAVIEKLVYSGGQLSQIITSNSAFNQYQPPRYPQNDFPWFYLEYIDPSDLDHWDNQHFKGFIYHPKYPPGSGSIMPPQFIASVSSLFTKEEKPNIKIVGRRRRENE